jgi:hypothetical protein
MIGQVRSPSSAELTGPDPSGPGHLPAPRGPWSERVIAEVTGTGPARDVCAVPDLPLADDDLQLALYVCYELSYRGFAGVPDEMEWHPGVLGLRADMEAVFEAALAERMPSDGVAPDVAAFLRDLDARSEMLLARHLAREATLEQTREFVIHRSAYHLKEADPHSFAIPRLSGAVKTAFVEIQADEYGGGKPERAHARLFATMMSGLGLDPAYGAYLDAIPGTTLATVNLMSLFGLHRRWRGAAVGHLALFELGSPRPNRLYGDGLRRLGCGPEVTDFHDEHVEADAAHSMIATYDLADRLSREEPGLAADIVFGARALDLLDGAAAEHMLRSWRAGRSSLLGS